MYAMSGVTKRLILDYLTGSRDTVQATIDDPAFSSAVWDIAQVTATALRNGGKLLLAGNGGSAGDAAVTRCTRSMPVCG